MDLDVIEGSTSFTVYDDSVVDDGEQQQVVEIDNVDLISSLAPAAFMLSLVVSVNISLKLWLALTQPKPHNLLTHVIITLAGLAVMILSLPHTYLVQTLSYYVIAYFSFLTAIRHIHTAPCLNWLFCGVVIGVNETLVHTLDVDYSRLRPILMSFNMKLITATTVSPVHNIPIVEDFSYLCHPASTIFGIWHERLSKREHYLPPKLGTKLLWPPILALIYFFISFLPPQYISDRYNYLTVDYLAEFLPIDIIEFHWNCVRTYLVALQFRFSHYFMCTLAQFLLLLWNDSTRICDPLDMECPRSLTQVVVSWNYPMHLWLKTYVFNPLTKTYKQQSMLIPILGTYLVSSILHGLKFQIWSVLLCLGLFTWIEHRLRSALSISFSACIACRPCTTKTIKNQQSCLSNHIYTPQNSWGIKIVNFIFSLIAIWHLAFLGSSFEESLETFDWHGVLSIWSDQNFSSFGLAASMELINYLLK